MVNLEDRQRKVDVEKMTDEQMDRVLETINAKLVEIAEEAAQKANKLLNIYGLETKLQFLTPYLLGKEKD